MEPKVFALIILELQKTGVTTTGLNTVGETFIYKDLEVLLEIAQFHNFRGHLMQLVEGETLPREKQKKYLTKSQIEA